MEREAAPKPAVSSAAAGLESPAPTQIGPYRVLETLGKGGMGTVFLAEQSEPFHRLVALKLIRVTKTGPEAKLRFEAERQALARMNHPHIAQVFEAGTTLDGQPYIAMEHVPGERITRFCDQRRLGVRQRLELFITVCEGVQHAHQKGVLHRDLKPSNILVTEADGAPAVKIIDFGIAKALDRPLTDETLQTGDRLLGTPAYLSPEAIHASGDDIDTRTDVYSLGVLLYELLVGVLPYGTKGESFLQLIRKISSNDDAPRPSTRIVTLDAATKGELAERRRIDLSAFGRLLRSDLDWITMMAIAKDPDRRYASAAELAADVGRHLRHEAVIASPPSAAYRVGKFVRRHRAGVAAAVLAVMAMAAGLILRTVEAARANREAEVARQVTALLVDLFEVSDPGESRGNSITAREVLDAGAARIRTELTGQPLVRAAMMDSIGRVYDKLGLYSLADPLLEEGLSIRQEILHHNDADVGRSLHHLALLRHHQGDLERAGELFETAIQVRSAALGESHPEVAESLSGFAYLLYSKGEQKRAEPMFLRAIELRERSLGRDDLAVGDSLNDLSLLYREQGDFERAEPLLLRVLKIQDQRLPEDHPDLGVTLANLAAIYYETGDFERAIPLFQRDLEISEKALGSEHPSVAISLNNLASLERELGNYSAALELHRRALEIRLAVFGEQHSSVAVSYHNMAGLHRDQGQLEEALAMYRKAEHVWSRALGSEHPNLGSCYAQLAKVYRDSGDLTSAENLFRRALTIRESAFGDDHQRVGEVLTALADVAIERRRLSEAAALLERAAVILEQGSATDQDCRACRSALATNHLVWGELEEASGRLPTAIAHWSQTLELIEPLSERSRSMRYRATHSRALMRLGKLEQARPMVDDLIAKGWRQDGFEEFARSYGL